MKNKYTQIINALPGEKVWIVAHRGKFGGCIPENTLDSFDVALNSGADIIETDITKLSDGRFVLFHDDTADRITVRRGPINQYTYEQMRQDELLNSIGEPSGRFINTLEEMLEHLNGRCMINLDKCRNNIEKIFDVVRTYDMEDQILLKNPASNQEDIEWLKTTQYHPHFVPVVRNDEEIESLYKVMREIKVSIVEVFFRTEDCMTIDKDFIASLHRQGIKVWVNALRLGGEKILNAGRDDDRSILSSQEEGWGWLVERGADIIQTDWPMELNHYLTSIGKR